MTPYTRCVIPSLLITWCRLSFSSAFLVQGRHDCPPLRPGSSSASATTAAAASTTTNVTTVVVCTGHLCRCVEDNASADDILRALQENEQMLSSSSCRVEESVCLGQCGTQAVVALDYADGTSKVCFGMQEVVQELGLLEEHQPSHDDQTTNKEEEEPTPSRLVAPAALTTLLQIEDPRDRMRATAKEQAKDDNFNPWMNAAALLAQKMFGQV